MQKYVPLPLAYCSENFRIISKLFSVAVSDAQKPRATRSRQSSLPFPPSSSSPRSVPVFARLVSSSSSSTPPIAPIGDTHHHPSPTRARSHPPSHPHARASSSSLPFIPRRVHHTPRRALERSVGRARGRSVHRGVRDAPADARTFAPRRVFGLERRIVVAIVAVVVVPIVPIGIAM